MNMISRKFKRGMWCCHDYFQPNDIGADVLSRCFTTRNNMMSWWRCTNDEKDVSEVALALACNMDHLEKIDIVTFSLSELENNNIKIRDIDGETPITELRDRHVDMIQITTDQLVLIVKNLAPKIRLDHDSVFTFTEGQLKTLVRTAIKNDRVKLQDLKENIRKKIIPIPR